MKDLAKKNEGIVGTVVGTFTSKSRKQFITVRVPTDDRVVRKAGGRDGRMLEFSCPTGVVSLPNDRGVVDIVARTTKSRHIKPYTLSTALTLPKDVKVVSGKTKVRVEYTTEGKITKMEHVKDVVRFKGTANVQWTSLAEAAASVPGGSVAGAGGAVASRPAKTLPLARTTRVPGPGEKISRVCYNEDYDGPCVAPIGRAQKGKKISEADWNNPEFGLRYGDVISYKVVETRIRAKGGKIMTKRQVKVMGLLPNDEGKGQETKE